MNIMTPRDRTVAEMTAIANSYGFTLDDVMKSRRHECARIRHEIAYHFVIERGKGLSETARIMGMRDHSVIVYQVGRHLMRIGRTEHRLARQTANFMARRLEWHRKRSKRMRDANQSV